MWGSPVGVVLHPVLPVIRPTYVGITPYDVAETLQLSESAPRMWGSPASLRRVWVRQLIRPTYVGITLGQPAPKMTPFIRPTYVGITPA